MNRSRNKRLTLSRETLRSIADRRLGDVNGGAKEYSDVAGRECNSEYTYCESKCGCLAGVPLPPPPGPVFGIKLK